ncbi:MAG TPA: alpha/beta fold hydrolase [Candidatus Dormibacteraeota bacterium]
MPKPVIVLVHSSSVGPSTWAPVADHLRRGGLDVQVPSMLGFVEAGPPYVRGYLDACARAVISVPADRDVVLVGHSNAGLFLPAIAATLAPRHVSLVFADASVPERDAQDVQLVPEAILPWLRTIATDGVLPRWTDWWPDDDANALYPNAATRTTASAEEPSLPLAFFEESVPVPQRWSERPCAYLLFSEGYRPEAARAATYGWPVRTESGEHLHMLVDPAAVAAAIEDLTDALARETTSWQA